VSGGVLAGNDLERLERCLRADGVAVVPTDTVYGLACNPESAVAVNRVYELKRRPPRKPAAVMYFDLDVALAALPELGERAGVALRELLPGPVTLLLPNPQGRFPLACEGGLLGLRVPRLSDRLAPLAGVGAPALQSSANLSGGPDPRRLGDVPPELREGADLVLDGGELPGTASTVVDLSSYEQTGEWHVVREGPVGREALAESLAVPGSC
jgi:L-threonylcarbamoyladenylate synthase